MCFDALEIGPIDEVIVPGMTWVACPQSVYNCGAIPVLVDIDPKTISVSVKEITENITPNTKAILMVHAYCGLSDIDKIVDLAKKYTVMSMDLLMVIN